MRASLKQEIRFPLSLYEVTRYLYPYSRIITIFLKKHLQFMVYSPIAFVSSLFAFKIENLNFALTSLLLHDSNKRYRDR